MSEGTEIGPERPAMDLEFGQHRIHADTVPRPARSYQGQRAGIVTRTAAGAIDYLLVIVAVVGTFVGWSAILFLLDPRTFQWPSWSFARFVLLGFVYMTFYLTVAWATTGRSYGGRLLGVRVVNFRGRTMTWPGALVRAGFCAVFPIGLFWTAASRQNRSVQDVVLRTSVIHDWLPHRRTPLEIELDG